jgi:hypothetical protein
LTDNQQFLSLPKFALSANEYPSPEAERLPASTDPATLDMFLRQFGGR